MSLHIMSWWSCRSNCGARLLAGTVAGVLVAGYLYRQWTKRKMEFVQVGTVTKIYIYPVKSCRGIETTEADAFEMGLQYKNINDRHWIVVDGKGNMLTQRQLPKLAMVVPSIHVHELHLNAEDMETLKLPIHMDFPGDDNVTSIKIHRTEARGADCGEAAADWISTYLKKPGCRIMYFLPEFQPRVVKDNQHVKHLCLDKDKTAYQDIAPVLLVVQESVEDFARQVPDSNVSEVNYRPNILVSCSKAFDEEKWSTFQIGKDVSGRVIFKCSRCTLPCVNPETGQMDTKFTLKKSLEKYRPAWFREKAIYGNCGMMGVYLSMDELGPIKVGDPVLVTYQ